jgi:two-component system, cell cycle response regulator
MRSTTISKPGPAVLLATPDSVLMLDVQRTLIGLGLRMEAVSDAESAVAAMGAIKTEGIVLLDVRLPGVANGCLLATMHEHGVHKRCAIAVIADHVSDDWIARLRQGVIDDIVARTADASAWRTHISTMQRGHALYCELELLRETARVELEHDRVTGVFNREMMLTILFRETDRVQRLRSALTVVMFDVDDFGRWNNELGHNCCDMLLREMTTRTGRTLRSYDMLGRVGNDEFLLALPGCSTIDAMMLAERLRMDVFGEAFLVKNADGYPLQVRLTASFAIASSRGRSPVVVLREAEQTLAQCRLSGPDTMRCASEAQLPTEPEGGPGADGPKLFTKLETANL